VGNSRSRTPWTRCVVGSSRPRLETGGAGPGDEARSREASKRRSATAGRSRRTGHHRATSRTDRCPKLRAAAFRLTARGLRVGAAAAPSSSETVMEMLRIVDDGIGKEAVAKWWPWWVCHFSGWVGSWPGKREPNQGGPIYDASALWRATGHGRSKISHSTAVGDICRYQLFQPSATAVTCRPPRPAHELHTCHAQPFPTSPVSCFKERAGAHPSDVVTQG
jgi:hypothetical protein